MGELEEIVATADGYRRASDLLLLEELILAGMSPKSTECRGHVIAQQSRVQSLRRVVDHFATSLKPAAPEPSE